MNFSPEVYSQASEAIRHWKVVLPTIEFPPSSQFCAWLTKNELPEVFLAIDKAAHKNSRMGGQMTAIHAARFVSAILSAKRRKWQEKEMEQAA
jgi:DNA recombination-dependent growth factor C